MTDDKIILSEEETNKVLKELISSPESKLEELKDIVQNNELIKQPEPVQDKPKSKVSRWFEAMKHPSPQTIIRNQWAFSFGFALGTLGLAIYLIYGAWHARTIQSYIWTFLGICGFGITYWQVKAIGAQMRLMNADFEGQMKKLMENVK